MWVNFGKVSIKNRPKNIYKNGLAAGQTAAVRKLVRYR